MDAVQIVGVISDTHGLLRPEVFEAFAGVHLILHGGDIGSPDVLNSLRSIAPVIAVRGNNDGSAWAESLPETADTTVGRRRVYVIHDIKEMTFDPRAAGFDVVISGHSHKPVIEERDRTLFVNPGSAGPRRFKLPVTVARLEIKGSRITPELIELIKVKAA